MSNPAAEPKNEPLDPSWVICPKCDRNLKLCRRREAGGYEMKSGSRRAVIYAGTVICPRCQYEQPIPPTHSKTPQGGGTTPRKEPANGRH